VRLQAIKSSTSETAGYQVIFLWDQRLPNLWDCRLPSHLPVRMQATKLSTWDRRLPSHLTVRLQATR